MIPFPTTITKSMIAIDADAGTNAVAKLEPRGPQGTREKTPDETMQQPEVIRGSIVLPWYEWEGTDESSNKGLRNKYSYWFQIRNRKFAVNGDKGYERVRDQKPAVRVQFYKELRKEISKCREHGYSGFSASRDFIPAFKRIERVDLLTIDDSVIHEILCHLQEQQLNTFARSSKMTRKIKNFSSFL